MNALELKTLHATEQEAERLADQWTRIDGETKKNLLEYAMTMATADRQVLLCPNITRIFGRFAALAFTQAGLLAAQRADEIGEGAGQ